MLLHACSLLWLIWGVVWPRSHLLVCFSVSFLLWGFWGALWVFQGCIFPVVFAQFLLFFSIRFFCTACFCRVLRCTCVLLCHILGFLWRPSLWCVTAGTLSNSFFKFIILNFRLIALLYLLCVIGALFFVFSCVLLCLFMRHCV